MLFPHVISTVRPAHGDQRLRPALLAAATEPRGDRADGPAECRRLLDASLERVVRRVGDIGGVDAVAASVRAATTALHLANLAELVEESATLAGDGPLNQLAATDPHRFDGVLAQPVLTAHPTEARRMTLRRHLERVRRALEAVRGKPRSATALEELDVAVELLYRTDSVRHTTLRVVDEVSFAETFLSGPLAEAAITVEWLAQPHAAATASPRVRLGSWIGGDQDGNPHCTADDLRRALAGARRIAVERHRAFAREAAGCLSLARSVTDLDPATREWLETYAADRVRQRHRGEVLRLCALVIAERLEAPPPWGYAGRADLATDIERLAAELARAGVPHLVTPLLGRWRAWSRLAGLNLVDLDVRTRSEVGLALARQAHPGADGGATAGDLAALLVAPPPRAADAEATQLLDALAAWAETARTTSDLRGSFILSRCSGPEEIVAALWLLRLHPPLDARIRVAPLFEDEAALKRCGATLAAVFGVPEYLRSLEAHGGVQEVTLGYSDTIKGSGYLSGHLHLRSAHTAVATACDAAGVTPLVFHGRGGTVARGGGPTADAILAQPRGTIRGRLRWTEQGESIALRFDDPVVGASHLAETLLALARTTSESGDPAALPAWLDEVAARSRQVYVAWYTDPELALFHRAFTPIDAIERLAIGSRPARRGAESSPATLRAIPWHFSWSQTRIVASVWFGAGTALAGVVADAGGLEEARALYRRSTWFRSIIDNLEMVLFKTDWEIGDLYAQLATDAGACRWLPRLRREYLDCVEAVLRIRQGEALLDHQPGLRRRILGRASALRRLHELQVALLAQWRRDGDEAVLRLVHGTINGIAAGVQNTG